MADQGRLSGVSRRVADLVELLGGSQRAFAKRVGCSHSVIAKILRGEQEPGRRLLSRIAELPEINADWLLTGEGNPLVKVAGSNEFRVPLASSLLPGLPQEHPHLLSGESLAVPVGLHRDTVYAVHAACCIPASEDPEERFAINDYVLIDANPNIWRSNLQVLHQRLAVTALRSANPPVITLRRVQVAYDEPQERWKLRACLGAGFRDASTYNIESDTDVDPLGRPIRCLEIGQASPVSMSAFGAEISVSEVVGVAIQLTRFL